MWQGGNGDLIWVIHLDLGCKFTLFLKGERGFSYSVLIFFCMIWLHFVVLLD